MLTAILYALRCAPKFWFYFFKDFRKYIIDKKWRDFNYWGLHLFVGKFGAGKTISAVRRAYWACKTHRDVTVLSNITLSGFPEDTNYIPFKNIYQVLDLPDKSIVLLDEIGSIFNNRDLMYAKVKGENRPLPKQVFQHLVQMRHRRIMVLGTVSRWSLMDKQLRDISDTVTECHSWFADPLSRYTTCAEYDAEQYDKLFNNPLLPIRRIGYYGYVQTDELRSKYDTMQLVEGLLDGDYEPDDQILANRAGTEFNPHQIGGTRKQNSQIRKGLKR